MKGIEITDDARSPDDNHVGVVDHADDEKDEENEQVSNDFGWSDWQASRHI